MEISPKDQVVAFIRRSKHILLVTSEKASGDGIASLLSMQQLLLGLGKEVSAVISEGVPQNFTFLPGSGDIKTKMDQGGDFVIALSTNNTDVDRVKYTINDHSVDIIVSPKSGMFSPEDVTFKQYVGDFDLIITLDCLSLESLGMVFENHTELFSQIPVLNISANPANEFFGKVNLVETACSSTSEIIFELVSENEQFSSFLTEDLATTLLSGIISSTGSFLETCTTPNSLDYASALQALGARQSDIIEHLFKRKSLLMLKTWGRVLGNLEVDPLHRFAWSVVTKTDFDVISSHPSDIGGISDEILRHIADIDFTVLFVSQKNNVLVEIRTSHPGISFQKIKKEFGGEFVANGLNIVFEKMNISNIQNKLIEAFLHFQKSRLNLDENIKLQKLELQKNTSDLFKDISKSVDEERGFSGEVKPTPPSSIPFDAPFQPHEKTGTISTKSVEAEKVDAIINSDEVSVPPGTQAAEIEIDTGGQKVPDWLKKTFPKN